MYKSHSSTLLLLEIELHPVFGHYKQRCCKRPCICLWVNKCTTFSRVYTKADLLNRVGARSDFRDAAKLLLNTAVLSTGCSAELSVELYKDPESRVPPLICCIRTSGEEVETSVFLKRLTSDSPAHPGWRATLTPLQSGSHPQDSKSRDFPGGPMVKNPPANAGDMSSIPGVRRFHIPHSN